MSRARRPRERQDTWRSVSTALALGGLLVTLVFNTIGVWQQVEQAELGVRQADETRRAAELEVLTQLNATAAASDAEINETEAWDRVCDGDEHRIQSLTDAGEARILAALDQYDYLAFLLSRRLVTMREAGQYWQRDMVEAYHLGVTFIDPGWLDRHYEHLRAFYERSPASLRPCD